MILPDPRNIPPEYEIPPEPPTEDELKYAERAQLLKAMGHPTRLLILELLDEMTLPVGALEDQIELPQPIISQHLAVLRRSGLVEARVNGTSRQYRIADKRILEVLKALKS